MQNLNSMSFSLSNPLYERVSAKSSWHVNMFHLNKGFFGCNISLLTAIQRRYLLSPRGLNFTLCVFPIMIDVNLFFLRGNPLQRSLLHVILNLSTFTCKLQRFSARKLWIFCSFVVCGVFFIICETLTIVSAATAA